MHCAALFPTVPSRCSLPARQPAFRQRPALGSAKAPRAGPRGAEGRVGIRCGWAERKRLYLPRSPAEPGAPEAAASTPGRGGRAGAQSAWRRRLSAGAMAAPRSAGKGAPPERP